MDRPTAIMEILIMLIVAFIIGFIIAWLLRKNKKEVVTQVNDNSAELNNLRMKLTASEESNGKLRANMDKLKGELDDCISSKEETVIAPQVVEPVVTKAIDSVESDKANAEKLGFEVASIDDKDDLTKIKGVGPFIEKKLNGLGIYTFKQISGFTDDTIERVTEAIEFFPGRIQRDNWVSQAGDLHNEKNG
ncbi:MAG: hypothetical protein AAFN93_00140 [Bacteroidota bacterium]